PLFKNDQPDEIKAKLEELKDEPVDEFPDIKQEEPMADIYCPSTGNSRPIDAIILPSSENTLNIRECQVKDHAIRKVVTERPILWNISSIGSDKVLFI
ncbi:hypothetical protein PMAYCL1PPCAC_08300, partial [Pristionchus mayeri]